MALAPGSGAILKPIFDKSFGVKEIVVIDGGKNYSSSNPPILGIENCGVPVEEAILYPIINDESGKIVHVRVLASGRGYNPLRIIITPEQDTDDLDTSVNVPSLPVSNSYSLTSFSFTHTPPLLKIRTNNLPDPAPIGNYPPNIPPIPDVLAQQYEHTIYYRGGKSVKSANYEEVVPGQIAIMNNGIPLVAPIAEGNFGNVPTGFHLDLARFDSYPQDEYSGNVHPETGLYTYTDARLLPAWRLDDSVAELGEYYSSSGYQGDHLRHSDGHSKILGLTYDGYPIYGPYAYANPLSPTGGTQIDGGITLDNDTTTLTNESTINVVKRMESSFRYREGTEIQGNRGEIVEPADQETIYVSVGVDNTENKATGVFYINGEEQPRINLKRGRTYIFDQNDSTNEDYGLPGSAIRQHHFMVSETENGTHVGGTHYEAGVTYWLDGVQVSMDEYTENMANAGDRYVKFEVPVDAPSRLYYWCHNHINKGNRMNIDGWPMGTFVEDYIYDESIGDLDEHNGRFCVTPDYPSGTYAYFLTVNDTNTIPQYPYLIGPSFYSTPALLGGPTPTIQTDTPSGAKAEAVLTPSGGISYVNILSSGDGYFRPADVKVLGGAGQGAELRAVTQSVTGLSIQESGREYATPPRLQFLGGGGIGAKGVATIDPTGIVTDIVIDNPGRFYNEPPFIYITGGAGGGAKAVAQINQGLITNIEITDPGAGYDSAPNIVFTKLVNVKRTARNRISFNAETFFLFGLVKSLDDVETTIILSDATSLPGSGSILLGREIIDYTSKSGNKLLNCTRGVNFRYDQRVVLDSIQDLPNGGASQYQFNVGDRIVRRIENENNKVARVYDWNNETKELFVVFEVDELAFIDAGRADVDENIVAFDAGLPTSATQQYAPHTVVQLSGDSNKYITALTEPITILDNVAFEDDDELDGEGDGIPDLINTNTDYENQIKLDGGIPSSLYGLEETVGGENTTLLQIGDQIKDASIPYKFATIADAGGLDAGIPHTAQITMYLDIEDSNIQNFTVGESVQGEDSLVGATVVSWDAETGILVVKDPVPHDTGNPLIGEGGIFYTFSDKSSIVEIRVVSPGLDYTAPPIVQIEDVGWVAATATAVMTTSGDQVSSFNVTKNGYGYKYDLITGTMHPTVTMTNAPGDTTGSGATAEVVLGGEMIVGALASWRIKKIDYDILVRNN